MGTRRGYTGAMMRAFGAGEWVLTVRSVQDVTEHYRRIVVDAPGLFDGTPYGPGSFIRLWVPDPDDPAREHQRGYTIAALDEAAEQLTLEFVLHEPAGPACHWAANVQVGDQIAATRWGAPRFEPPVPAPAGYLLVGDPASIPAINAIVEEIGRLPGRPPVDVYLEYTHDDDRTLLTAAAPGLRTTWVRRTGDPDVLVRAIEADGTRDWSDWFAWVTVETAATKAVRGRLKEWGFPKTHLKAQGYWSAGKQMGLSRDTEAVDEMVEPAPPVEPVATPAVTPAASRWQASSGAALLAPLKRTLVIAGVVQGLVSLAELVPFVLLAILAARLLDGERDPSRFWTLGLWAIGLMAAAAVVSAVLLFALHLMDARFGLALRRRLVDRIARVPLGWFTDRNSAAVHKVVYDDVAGLHHLTTHAVVDAVAAVVTPVAVLVTLFVVHPGLAALLLIPLIAVYILSMRMFNASSYGIATFEAKLAEVSETAGAHLAAQATARIYDRGDDARLGRVLTSRAAFLDSWQRPLTGLKTANDLVTRPTTMLAYLLVLGVPLHVLGWISAGDLVLFLLVGTTFGARLMAVAYGFVPIREALAAAREIAATLAEPVLAQPADPTPLPVVRERGRRVVFESVTFGYDEAHPVLHDVDLTLEPGTVTALVGPSGAGKTSLATLLARFHDVTGGRITVDGVDLRDLATDELYGAVAFVFQGRSLVRESVHDNIALGRPDATREQVEQAARAAQVHERISRLPRGYDSVVGEDAVLSGGEAQRVAVARALLADPAILVLDEATAHADPESEHLVQAALSELVRDRTVLVVSHRLHTLTGADRIVVLDQGRIVDSGRHDELLARGGLYRELWDADQAAIESGAQGDATDLAKVGAR